MCDCEGLRDDRRADIIQQNKNTSWESKSIHCAMEPMIRTQFHSLHKCAISFFYNIA